MAGYFDIFKKRESVADPAGYFERNPVVAGAVGTAARGFGSVLDNAPVMPAYIAKILRNAMVGTPDQAVQGSALARPESEFDPKQSAYDLGAALPDAATAGLGLRGIAGSGGGMGGAGLEQVGAIGRVKGAAAYKLPKSQMTVIEPQRNAMFPPLYGEPDKLVGHAVDIARKTPESDNLFKVFGVHREDLRDQALGFTGDDPNWKPPTQTDKGKGAAVARQVMGPKNTQRLVDILGEAQKHPELSTGMIGWYNMLPAYERLKMITELEDANKKFTNLNHFTGMSSPNSEVLKEITRGTAANWLSNEGRFDDFKQYGGMSADKKASRAPADMQNIPGHMAHSTAHVKPMENWLGGNPIEQAKVPSYIAASQPPGLGQQVNYPVGDAHWARAVGLADVRSSTKKDLEMKQKLQSGEIDAKKYGEYLKSLGASATLTEMKSLAPWFREKVAREVGLEGVPGQALLWGAGAASTGVKSGIGVPKLEMLADQIVKAAQREGVPIHVMRDRVLMGKAHAGKALPEILAGTAAAGAASIAGYRAMQGGQQEQQPPPGQQEALMRLMSQQGMY